MANEGSRAVFLSYASQDAEAARRIAAALRAADIEVWFDQSELRGGDAWDQKLRKQIKECALFVPIISANTQARAEGYFRLEWRLADQRTHLMGKSKAFLVPVCIDDTSDADADVPDSFLAVQWMRQSGGAVDKTFFTRIASLFQGAVERPSGAVTSNHYPSVSQALVGGTKRNRWIPAAAAIALVVAGLALFWKPWQESEQTLLRFDTDTERLDPGDDYFGAAFPNVIFAELKAGKPENALEVFRKAKPALVESGVELKQDNINDAILLARIQLEAGQRTQAEALVDRIADATPALTRMGNFGFYGNDAFRTPPL